MIEYLPNSPDTERALLGAPFIDESVFVQIAALEPSLFYTPSHREAFIAMRNLADRNEPISPITVFEEMKLIAPATTATVATVANWVHSGGNLIRNLDAHISTLKDKALKRDLIRSCNALAEEVSNEADLGSNLAGRAVSIFQDSYLGSLNGNKPTVTLEEGLEHNYERWSKMLRNEIVTIETGIEDIDSQLTGGGLEKGMAHVIGARPGKGKTTLGLDIAAHNLLYQNSVVVFFTMELSKDVLLDRLIAPLAGVPRWQITSKWMDENTRATLIKVGEAIKKLPLFVNAKARTVKDMRLVLREIAQITGGKIDLVITDFLTKMHYAGNNQYQGVTANANGLADFAAEFGCASIILSQLSRETEKRSASDPARQGEIKLTDFRDSGAIEELGRTIIGLWGNDESAPYRVVKMTCLKQGEGGLFEVDATFDTNFMTFGVRRNLLKQTERPAHTS